MKASQTSDPGTVLRAARRRASMSQRELGAAAGTSAPTIAMYENGHKEPRISTLANLIAATGGELHVVVTSRDSVENSEMTREQRRSLALYRVVVRKLLADPDAIVARARYNLTRMRELNDASSEPWFDAWDYLLDGPIELLVAVLTSPTQRAASLRQVSPFSGVLSPSERWDVYREFRQREASSAA